MTAAVEMKADTEPWWRRWFVMPVIRQLAQGISPDRLGWSVAAGMTLGIFPIMGSTTLICIAAAWALGLNQPVTHLFKSAMYPLHLPLILVFIHLGQRLFGVPLLTLSIPELLGRFKDDPARFAGDFGMAALHGVTAWLLVAPLLALAI
ncbi:MAG: DUF2062 domain-containing protein, partial [Verrucomicrobiaceae bacterium]